MPKKRAATTPAVRSLALISLFLLQMKISSKSCQPGPEDGRGGAESGRVPETDCKAREKNMSPCRSRQREPCQGMTAQQRAASSETRLHRSKLKEIRLRRIEKQECTQNVRKTPITSAGCKLNLLYCLILFLTEVDALRVMNDFHSNCAVKNINCVNFTLD